MNTLNSSPFHPTERMLRQFSVLWVIFFGAIAVRQEFHGRHVLAISLAVLAITLGPLGMVWPRLIRPVFVGWMALAYPIGWIVSRIVLGSIFYGLFTPVALLFRLRGRDALELRRKPNAASFWSPKPVIGDKSQYLSQF